MKMYTYTSYCCANHKGVFRGLFAKRRNERWWRKHDRCPCVDYKVWSKARDGTSPSRQE